jgi:hypothetical protein
MRHAGPDALARLAPLLAELRTINGLRERSPGVFYRGSRAFLHFHEGPAGDFADVRLDADFERFRVNEPDEQSHLLAHIRYSLDGKAGAGVR